MSRRYIVVTSLNKRDLTGQKEDGGVHFEGGAKEKAISKRNVPSPDAGVEGHAAFVLAQPGAPAWPKSLALRGVYALPLPSLCYVIHRG